MARRISLLSVLIVLLIAEANLIMTASELEGRVGKFLGRTRRALSFAHFAERYEKKYETEEEVKFRFKIFEENQKLIESTNRKGLSYTLAINYYGDWTWEEFQRHKLGASQNCSATIKGNHKLTHAVLPQTKDWRDSDIIGPIKDQGLCGSCWAFSATGALEAAYKQTHGKYVSLSEQQLLDCAGHFNNRGCKGGLPSHAFEYIIFNGGLEAEATYPYEQSDRACRFSAKNVAVKVVDSVNITMGDEDELKDAVGVVRPVSVAFHMVIGFIFYKEGIYTSTACGNRTRDVNHAVLAVGYGVENGVPYWLLKNSWGQAWGDHGYFKMLLGTNMCGIATCASYPIVA